MNQRVRSFGDKSQRLRDVGEEVRGVKNFARDTTDEVVWKLEYRQVRDETSMRKEKKVVIGGA